MTTPRYVVEDNFPERSLTASNLRTAVTTVGQLVTGLLRSTEARKTRNLLRSFLALFA